MRIVNSRSVLLDSLIELIGIKTGLLLQKEQLIKFLEQTFASVDNVAHVLGGASTWWQGEPNEMVAIRAEEIEANIILVMQSVGAISDSRTPYELVIDFVHQNPVLFGIHALEDEEAIWEVIEELDQRLADGEIPFGTQGLAIEYQRRDIMNRNMPDQRTWDGVVSLNDLFESEDIPANSSPQHYFDQRYIDYLNVQSEDLASIHWRQFEFLTGEYFRRQGYKVTITPPRGDGGVDVIAERPNDTVGPDLIVVQCRRYASDRPVSIDEVKAFWTSVDEHRATKGLIVTTSHLTSGGRAFTEARKYRLSAIEGENVRTWLLAQSSHSSELPQV